MNINARNSVYYAVAFLVLYLASAIIRGLGAAVIDTVAAVLFTGFGLCLAHAAGRTGIFARWLVGTVSVASGAVLIAWIWCGYAANNIYTAGYQPYYDAANALLFTFTVLACILILAFAAVCLQRNSGLSVWGGRMFTMGSVLPATVGYMELVANEFFELGPVVFALWIIGASVVARVSTGKPAVLAANAS